MRKILTLLIMIVLITSCDGLNSTRKRLLVNKEFPDITKVQEMDTIYHIGDSIYENKTIYYIKR